MLTTIKDNACYTVKIFKNKPRRNIFKGGGGLWSAVEPLKGLKKHNRQVASKKVVYKT